MLGVGNSHCIWLSCDTSGREGCARRSDEKIAPACGHWVLPRPLHPERAVVGSWHGKHGRSTWDNQAYRGAHCTRCGTSGKAASAGKSATGKKVNPALMKPLQPSKELAAVVGSDPLPRPEVVSKVWDYIKRNNLQNPQNKREIKADDKLEKVFGKKSVTMFEMNKHLAQHLK